MDMESPSRRRRDTLRGGVLPPPPGLLKQEDGFNIILEDASGNVLLEN